MKSTRIISLIRAFVLAFAVIFSVLLLLAFIIRIDEVVEAGGFVDNQTSHIIRVSSAGFVEDLRVKEGEQVRRGDMIAVIVNDSLDAQINDQKLALEQLEQKVVATEHKLNYLQSLGHPGELQSSLNSISRMSTSIGAATAEKEEQEVEVRRMEYLFKQGLISQRQYDQTRLRHRLMEAREEELKKSGAQLQHEFDMLKGRQADEIRRLKFELEQNRIEIEKKILDLQSLDKKQELWSISSPADGIVLLGQGKEQLVGKHFQAGEKLADLIDGQSLIFLAAVPEHEISKLQEGQAVHLEVNALPYQKYKIFEGKVYDIAKQATTDKASGAVVYQVKIQIDQPWVEAGEGGQNVRYYLRPGFSGLARIIIRPDMRFISWLRKQVFGDSI
jgi:multidrug efflux pump subunit AcrA (membrane-fusion protein)